MRIVKPIDRVWRSRAPRLILLTGALIGIASFIYYYVHRLTLAHYDAKAHMLVARRLFDSLEPGYAQMGAHWLPLVHLVYLPFVAFETQYRTGLLPSLISVGAFALSGWLTYRIAFRATGSIQAGVYAALILLANPNLLYLQSCPLTEPLYMALLLLATDSLIVWRDSDSSKQPWMAAIWTALGGLCRYEGWFFFGGVMLLLAYDWWRRNLPRRKAVQAGALFASLFAGAAIAHFGYISYKLGSIFFTRVAEGNPDPYMTYKRPFLSTVYHLGELSQMSSILPLLLAAMGLTLFIVGRARRDERRTRLPLLLLWLPSLINISALYWGLIYRLRYSALLIPAVAIFGALAMTSETAKRRAFLLIAAAAVALPWLSWYFAFAATEPTLVKGPGVALVPVVATLLFLIGRLRRRYGWALLPLCIVGMQIPLLEREDRPMMVETMEHEFIEPERQQIMNHLREHYDGSRILIDMGRQAPLVYDSGLNVREFVYNEGGTTFWHEAVRDPVGKVGWLVAENGDAVFQQLKRNPEWGNAYLLAKETESFSLYRHRK